MENKNFSVTYYPALKDVFWPLRLKRREKRKINVKKLEFARFATIQRFARKTIQLPLEAVSFYKTLEEVPRLLGPKKLKK